MSCIRHSSSLLVLLVLLAACQTPSRSAFNPRLKRELDSLYVVDQQYRELLMAGPAAKPRLDSVARAAGVPPERVFEYVNEQMVTRDSLNIRRVASIIRQYGYPGRTLVGEPTNEAAMMVIQHSARIPHYIQLIERAAAQGELPFDLYALMLDRHLMYQGKEQVYGTQGRGFGVPNPTTGQQEQVTFIWPIQDAAHVNERRRKAGFDLTVEANAQRLGIEYKPMTLEEARRIEQAAKAQP